MHRLRCALALAIATASPALAQSPPPPTPSAIQFTQVANRVGLSYYQNDDTMMMGAGSAFVDVDGDTFQDVVITGGQRTPRLFMNQQDGTFVATPPGSRIPLFRNVVAGGGIACADVENDGDQDIFFANNGADLFVTNDGTGQFTDATTSAHLDDERWSTAAAFGDYDNDGFLDLYVGNYIETMSFPNHTPWPNVLHHNRGDGTFEDVTAETDTGGHGTTLAVLWSDFDQDGDVDLFVGNDFGIYIEPNRLYRNDGKLGPDGRWNFSEISSQVGADSALYCMGISAGDYDGDGDLDYFFTNIGRKVLLRNDGATGFTDVSASAGCEGIHDPYLPNLFASSWGSGFVDFDSDLDLDLFVSNGFIPAICFIANSLDTPNFLYRNDGNGSFTEIAKVAGCEEKQKLGRSAAFADYDHDGDVDILQYCVASDLKLFRNDTSTTNRSLHVGLVGWKSNRDGAGARLVATVGDRQLLREATASYSFQSSSDPGAHFGLGAHDGVDLVVHWPSGIEQHLVDLPRGHDLVVHEPRCTLDVPGPGVPATLHSNESLRIAFTATNHDNGPHSMIWKLALSTDSPGTNTWPLLLGAGVVPSLGGGAFPIVVTTELPHAAKGRARLVLTLEDAAGGIDQRSFHTVIE